jgi:hypothetical protein
MGRLSLAKTAGRQSERGEAIDDVERDARGAFD